jgi:hypothetical protein
MCCKVSSPQSTCRRFALDPAIVGCRMIVLGPRLGTLVSTTRCATLLAVKSCARGSLDAAPAERLQAPDTESAEAIMTKPTRLIGRIMGIPFD